MSSATGAVGTAGAPHETTSNAGVPPSPARSDKSSESEGRPMREKLKETRIDAHASSDLAGAEHSMGNTRSESQPITVPLGDQSTSGSDSERGRLRRKRSHDDFEEDEGVKKRKEHEAHIRKKSRDVASPRVEEDDMPTKTSNGTIATANEDSGYPSVHSDGISAQAHASTSARPATPELSSTEKDVTSMTSPKNKRTHEQANIGATSLVDTVEEPSSQGTEGATKAPDEPNPKRQRDKSDLQTESQPAASVAKIPQPSGFTNASAASPFATLGSSRDAKNNALKPTDAPAPTSDVKFKSSGFATFTSSSASPFNTIGGSSSSSSPFAAATSGNKLSSFASPASTSTTSQSGLGALGAPLTKPAFGGSSGTTLGSTSAFGGALGSGFASLGGVKSSTASFATPGASGITGLSNKPAKPFGAQQSDDSEGEEDGDDAEPGNDEDVDNDSQHTEQDKQPVGFHKQIVETGEEGEETIWAGRAKLYTLDHEKKQWQENGTGPFKLNVTKEEPPKARFIVRADGTHRLLLNAAVTKDMRFGTANGEKPTDGKAWFNSLASDGKIKMHTVKMNPDRAKELYNALKLLQTEL